jgi:hypothetical protein
MRIYDSRLGRFLSVDPLTKSYPWYTPYQFAGNTPIWAIDLDGKEPEWAPTFLAEMIKGAAYIMAAYDASVKYQLQETNASIGMAGFGDAAVYGEGTATDRYGKTYFEYSMNPIESYKNVSLVSSYNSDQPQFTLGADFNAFSYNKAIDFSSDNFVKSVQKESPLNIGISEALGLNLSFREDYIGLGIDFAGLGFSFNNINPNINKSISITMEQDKTLNQLAEENHIKINEFVIKYNIEDKSYLLNIRGSNEDNVSIDLPTNIKMEKYDINGRKVDTFYSKEYKDEINEK